MTKFFIPKQRKGPAQKFHPEKKKKKVPSNCNESLTDELFVKLRTLLKR
jgi:hypothetical protein